LHNRAFQSIERSTISNRSKNTRSDDLLSVLFQSHRIVVVFGRLTGAGYDQLSKCHRPCGSATPFLPPLSPSEWVPPKTHIPRGGPQA
ncbi:hypothetical protein EDC04DRAFT_3117249, partial [Pisolithus marmoratus]